MSNLRPCIVNVDNKEVQAVFHMFYTEYWDVPPSPMIGGSPGGQMSMAMALVEYNDGTVGKVPACLIRFTDVKLKVSTNSDSSRVAEIRQAIKDNEGYCPCEIHKTPDTKCMCKAFREQTTPGLCHCGLYVKEVVHG